MKQKERLRATVDGKAMGPDGLPTEIFKLVLVRESLEILCYFQSMIITVWTSE